MVSITKETLPNIINNIIVNEALPLYQKEIENIFKFCKEKNFKIQDIQKNNNEIQIIAHKKKKDEELTVTFDICVKYDKITYPDILNEF